MVHLICAYMYLEHKYYQFIELIHYVYNIYIFLFL